MKIQLLFPWFIQKYFSALIDKFENIKTTTFKTELFATQNEEKTRQNKIYSGNARLMLSQRLRRCPNINPALADYILFYRNRFPLNKRYLTCQSHVEWQIWNVAAPEW